MIKKILMFLVFIQINLLFAHGFGAHAAHLEKIIELNLPGSYLELINNPTHPEYKAYFIYGSIFPDIQYATNFKNALADLYSEISDITGIEGLTYEIGLDDIPSNVDYVFGFNTHHDKYAMRFAEYLLTQAGLPDPPGHDPGGQDISDSKNRKIAFALGYYAHLCEDIVAHDFLVPRITAELDLGDIELVKSGSFADDPNAQTEGIIEGIVDHLYGENNLVAQTVYSDIWVATDQFEPSFAQTNPLMWLYNGELYDPQEYQNTINPVFTFFNEVVNDWYFNNPHSLSPDYKESNTPMTMSGLRELATIFRFVNRFYPSVAGHPFNGFDRFDEVFADWIVNHLDFTVGADIALVISEFYVLIAPINVKKYLFDKIVYPSTLEDVNRGLAEDARTLVTLMLADMDEADALVASSPDVVNVEEYNKLKNSILFSNPNSVFDPIWEEYLSLGCKIYAEIGPGGATPKWYSDWSPWHSQSMAWGAMSSLNNLLSGIYSSNPDIAIYNASFEIGGNEVTGPLPPSVFQSNSSAKIKVELYNTKNVSSQNIKLQVKKDHNSSVYSSDQMISNTTFAIDHNPENYGSVSRLNKELTFNISVGDLNDNQGYYFELVNPIINKATFTSSFEQYPEQLNLTPNYANLYSTYSKWPFSLGVTQNIATISTSVPQLTEESSTGGHYLINGIESSSIQIAINSYFNIEAIPPSDEYSFYKWSDGNTENPRNYRSTGTTTITAEMKKVQSSNNAAAYQNSSQQKTVKTSDGKLHLIYESLGKVWYESSNDNGSTWAVMNSGQPLSTNDSKNPAIDAYGNMVSAVWQEKNGSGWSLKVALYSGGDKTTESTLATGSSWSLDTTPSIAWGYNGKAVVVYRDYNYFGNLSICYRVGSFGYDNITLYGSEGYISNSSTTSYNPTIAALDNSSWPIKFHVAWESTFPSQSSRHIEYQRIDVSSSGTPTINSSNYKEISTYSYGTHYGPFVTNERPSIDVKSNGEVQLVWVGKTSSNAKIMKRSATNYGYWSSSFSYFDSYYVLYSPTVRYASDGDYVVGWGRNNGTFAKYWNSSSQSISSTNQQGRDIQLLKQVNSSQVKGVVFNYSTNPYSFASTSNVLAKIKDVETSRSREAVVVGDGCSYVFKLGDVSIDNRLIDFQPLEDSLLLNSKDVLSEIIMTKPFTFANNSELDFTVFSEIKGEEKVSLKKNELVEFSVELIDSETKKVIGLYEKVEYKKNKLSKLNKRSYTIKGKGIENKTVQLRVKTNTNLVSGFSISEIYELGDSTLGKKNVIDSSFQGLLGVEDYSLSQNYPNPFNPQTTISYQIPNNGTVTLKVYDLLGKEIAELVNEYKGAGRYDVLFDGSNLATGIYFYKLTSGNFTKIKKFILLK